MPFIPYDRQAAIGYAHYWSHKRNPHYYDFSTLGGDCTNFISQCLYAGCSIMNPNENGWYYYSIHQRSPSWTSASFLYQFLTSKPKRGPVGQVIDHPMLVPGDLIQLQNPQLIIHHTLIVVDILGFENYNQILVAAHSEDSDNRPLSTYVFHKLRFIHIEGANG